MLICLLYYVRPFKQCVDNIINCIVETVVLVIFLFMMNYYTRDRWTENMATFQFYIVFLSNFLILAVALIFIVLKCIFSSKKETTSTILENKSFDNIRDVDTDKVYYS